MRHTKKTALTAAVLTAAMSLTSCIGGDDTQNVNTPSSESEPQTTAADTASSAVNPAKTTASDKYEPSTEIIQDVYGPPENYEPPVEIAPETDADTSVSDENDTVTSEEPTTSEDLTKPQRMQLVYGPPDNIP